MSKFSGYSPRHKAKIEPIEGCYQCIIVDGVVVPHCDCKRHSGFIGATVE